MHAIYIDANIYLNFYDSKQQELKLLLTTLNELKNNILITSQIVDEVNRNKLRLFKKSLDTYTNQIKLPSTSLPEHLDDELNPLITKWNKKRKELEQAAERHNETLYDIYKDKLEAISKSKDKVSISLFKIFQQAVVADTETLEKAILRKRIGNPPGKAQDPLGDQLSWELLLTSVGTIDRLWIVTSDSDYYTLHENKCYLNPKLHDDLIKINPNLEVRCFNKLSVALKDFSITQPVNTLPTPEELSEIAKQEALSNKTVTVNVEFDKNSDICPACGDIFCIIKTVSIQKDGSMDKSYRCKVCGHQFRD